MRTYPRAEAVYVQMCGSIDNACISRMRGGFLSKVLIPVFCCVAQHNDGHRLDQCSAKRTIVEAMSVTYAG